MGVKVCHMEYSSGIKEENSLKSFIKLIKNGSIKHVLADYVRATYRQWFCRDPTAANVLYCY